MFAKNSLVFLILGLFLTGCAVTHPVVQVGSDRSTNQAVFIGQNLESPDEPWMNGFIRNLSTDCDLTVWLPYDFEINIRGAWENGPQIKIPPQMKTDDKQGIPLLIRVKPTLPGREYKIPYRFQCAGKSQNWKYFYFEVNGRAHDAPNNFDWEMHFDNK